MDQRHLGQVRVKHGGCTAKSVNLVNAFDAVWIIVGENRFTADPVEGCDPTLGEVVAQALERGQVGLGGQHMQVGVIGFDEAWEVDHIQNFGKIHFPERLSRCV